MSLPVTVLGGYLGAGKTTLVNQMLRQANGARICVLVNEFGALPIDEDLIEATGDDLISIAGGCICCSFGSDLSAALTRLAGLSPQPDHIVIEASGVALPGSIAITIGLVEELSLRGIMVLADASSIQKMAQDTYIGDTIERQLSDADMVIFSKTDLISNDCLNNLTKWLNLHWPNTSHLEAIQGRVLNSILLGEFSRNEPHIARPHADAQYSSVALTFDAPLDAEALAQELTCPSFGVLRAKGFVQDLSGRMALVQIAGRRAEVSWPEHREHVGLICIGVRDHLDLREIQQKYKLQI